MPTDAAARLRRQKFWKVSASEIFLFTINPMGTDGLSPYRSIAAKKK